MAKAKKMSRREFVASAVSTAAITSLPVHRLFAEVAQGTGANGAPTDSAGSKDSDWKNPDWKDQGVENLTKSPHAKLRDIPVRAVTIQSGFWSQRREINVTKSIPTMHDLLEANGRMNNFRRLVGKSQAAQSGPVFLGLRCLQVDRRSRLRPSVRRSTRASSHDRKNDCGGSCRTGAQRLPEHLLPGRSQVAANAHPNPNDRSRTLQHRTHAAGSDRILPRRPGIARCSMPESASSMIS